MLAPPGHFFLLGTEMAHRWGHQRPFQKVLARRDSPLTVTDEETSSGLSGAPSPAPGRRTLWGLSEGKDDSTHGGRAVRGRAPRDRNHRP